MGKAKIISGGTDGKYTVSVQYDTTAHKATIAKLEQQLGTIAAQISALSPRISTAETELDNAQQALDAAIASKDQTAMQSAIDVVQTKQEMLNALTTERHVLVLQQTAIEKQKEFLNDNVREERLQTAWCADFTEDLTGDVGTIECGRIDGTVIIKPGFDSAAYTPADGQLQDVLAMSPAGAYYNYAMITGVAKWKPRYRTGKVNNIDNDANTATVTIDDLEIAGLNINQQRQYEDVPFKYMTCNSHAFEDGDSVVVDMSDDNFAIIGFTDHPKQCGFKIARIAQILPADICRKINADAAMQMSYKLDGCIATWDASSSSYVIPDPPLAVAGSSSDEPKQFYFQHRPFYCIIKSTGDDGRWEFCVITLTDNNSLERVLVLDSSEYGASFNVWEDGQELLITPTPQMYVGAVFKIEWAIPPQPGSDFQLDWNVDSGSFEVDIDDPEKITITSLPEIVDYELDITVSSDRFAEPFVEKIVVPGIWIWDRIDYLGTPFSYTDYADYYIGDIWTWIEENTCTVPWEDMAGWASANYMKDGEERWNSVGFTEGRSNLVRELICDTTNLTVSEHDCRPKHCAYLAKCANLPTQRERDKCYYEASLAKTISMYPPATSDVSKIWDPLNRRYFKVSDVGPTIRICAKEYYHWERQTACDVNK